MTPQPSIAHYRITAKLGEGGMGEVYRATDTKLGRDVAIKILPEAFAQDPDRMARFAREAQVLASLNHPNIATIYGVENAGGMSVLVMELVEGPTLAERIAPGPLPAEEALPIARQIAEALEAAHERGIVHRDLKPANIKITGPASGNPGQVKVLDFGLAKAPEATGSGDPKNSPTLTMRATQAGVIMGTAGYMSPEQAAGQPVDKRADIWAYGVVLWEMLTGRPLFEGETVSHTLADVLRAEIDLNALPPGTPAVARTILRRCLDRKLKTRLRDIGEARIAIDEYLANPAEAEAEAKPQAATRKPMAWMAATGVLAVAAIALGILYFSQQPSELPVERFSIGPPDHATFFKRGGVVSDFALSPDGRRLVFSAQAVGGRQQLWLRSLDTFAAQPLAGTEGAVSPFWSPDSRSIGFAADGNLKRIEASGGPALTLASAPNFRGGTWSREGVILFTANSTSGTPLQRVPAAGGAARATTKLDDRNGELSHRFPWYLPDGRHFLVAASVSSSDHVLVRTGSLDSMETKALLDANSNTVYAEGHLLYLRESTLMAQPFDPKRLATTGDAVPIAEKVAQNYIANTVEGMFSVSGNGLLAYTTGESGSLALTWFDRNGKRLSTIGEGGLLGRVHVSPDRKSAAVSVQSRNNSDIWIYDLARGLRTRFTFDPAPEQEAVWSPDGRTIVFNSNRKGHFDLYRKNADGTGAEELLYGDGLDKSPTSWSPDGKFLLYNSNNGDIWVAAMTPGQPAAPVETHPWLQTPFAEIQAQFSPDGKWVSYQSNESGRTEIYVAPFPGPGGKRQVSATGGTLARWRRDGKEIFFVAPDNKLMAVEVNVKGATLETGETHPLFGPFITGRGFLYDVSPDGQGFLAVAPPEDSGKSAEEAIQVVRNWTATLRK